MGDSKGAVDTRWWGYILLQHDYPQAAAWKPYLTDM